MSWRQQIVFLLAPVLLCNGLAEKKSVTNSEAGAPPDGGVGIGLDFFREDPLPPPAPTAQDISGGQAGASVVATLQVPTHASIGELNAAAGGLRGLSLDDVVTSQEAKRQQAERASQEKPVVGGMSASRLFTLFSAGAGAFVQSARDNTAEKSTAETAGLAWWGGHVKEAPNDGGEQLRTQQHKMQQHGSNLEQASLLNDETLPKPSTVAAVAAPPPLEQPWRDAPHLSPGAAGLLTSLGRLPRNKAQ